MNSTPSKPPRLSFADKVELFESVLDRGADLRVRVTGRSMAPFLSDGDIVTLRRVPFSSLRWGDVIFFRNADSQPMMHRIVRWRRQGSATLAQTAGDTAASMDPPIGEGDIIGKVRFVERRRGALGGRKVDMESSRWRAINRVLASTSLARAGLRMVAKKLGLRAGPPSDEA